MRKVKKLLYILLILLLLGVFFYSSFRLWDYYSESHETQSQYDALSEMVQQARPTEGADLPTFDWSQYSDMDDEQIIEMPESPYVTVTDPETGKPVVMLPEFQELYAINRDIVGWISIEDTSIDYPVVQRRDAEDYYLYRDFYGNRVARGCIYVREACDVFAPSDNLVLYGHMMNDGTMFADLARYTGKAFWQEHQYIRFDTLRSRNLYQVVCVFKTTASQGEGFSYHLFNDARSEADFEEFWAGCLENALYDTGLEAQYGDKLISLSTCEYTQTNGRLVIVAKRVGN